jgi:hypothetical protein
VDERITRMARLDSRPRHAVPTLTALIVLCLALVGLLPKGIQAAGPPAMRLVAVGGHRIAVHGTGWPARDRMVLSVRYGGGSEGLELGSTARGAFTVAADSIDLCGGVTFVARDSAGHRATVQGPPLKCASRINPPRPVFTVLSGTKLQPHEVRVLGATGPHDVILHVGDALYLWLGGTATPVFLPKTKARYLFPLSMGTTPPRACAQVDCQAGFFWRWIALRPGETGIDLSPACRQTTPPCEIPDLLLRVHIEP